MKTELSKIAQDLEQGKITEHEARNLLLGLLGVSKSFAEDVKVKIIANTGGHNFEDGDIVTLIKQEDDIWLAKSELGETWWIKEDEANVC